MKFKKEFKLTEIVDEYVLVPIGETTVSFNGLGTLNEVGAFIWKHIEECETEAELLKMILAEYDVDEATAKADMDEFLSQLRDNDIID